MIADRGAGYVVPAAQLPVLAVEWCGEREWRSSAPLPIGRRVAIVSSRTRQLSDPRGTWMCGLRAVLAAYRGGSVVAVVSPGTVGCEFIARGWERHGVDRIMVAAGSNAVDPELCWSGGVWVVAGGCGPETERVVRARRRVRPAMGTADQAVLVAPKRTLGLETAASAPWRDRAVIGWADEVVVLAIRYGGYQHALLRERLSRPDANVTLVELPGLQSPRARAELIGLGAAVWPGHPIQSPGLAAGPLIRGPRRSGRVASVIKCPGEFGWDFLTHSTRACPGPWPGQTRLDYLDSVLADGRDADHSAMGTLVRIIRQRRLIASARAIRGGYRVVSFTEEPLSRLPALRVFRIHRARWDFEPYGICIRRRLLVERGSRAVLYGSDLDWNRLGVEDRPFFQRTGSGRSHGVAASSGMDWSFEREWRHVGDLDLSKVGADDAIVFVSDEREARMLLEICPWPVTVLECGGSRGIT